MKRAFPRPALWDFGIFKTKYLHIKIHLDIVMTDDLNPIDILGLIKSLRHS